MLNKQIKILCSLVFGFGALIPSSHAQNIDVGSGQVTLPDQFVMECMTYHSAPAATQHTLAVLTDIALSSASAQYMRGANTCQGIAKLLRYKNYLDLRGKGIKDLGPLSSLYQLEVLLLDNNEITNVEALVGLDRLRVLTLNHNPVRDVRVLTELDSLEFLEVRNTLVTDIASVLTHRLRRIDFRGAPVSYGAVRNAQDMAIYLQSLDMRADQQSTVRLRTRLVGP
jgi:hypothetical protein